MVILHIKRGDQDLFLYETKTSEKTTSVIRDITSIYNGRLKVDRICMEIEDLATHGTILPTEMIGLTDEQIEELKLKDTWADKCIPSGGFIFNKDPMGRRNGQQPQENMQTVLANAMRDAKELIDKKLVKQNKPLTLRIVEEALNLLRGAVTIVYPMQLPPHDPIRMEFTNTEDLSGTQASKEIIEPSKAQVWFAGRQFIPDKVLADYVGTNDKTKVVVKLNSHGEGPPGREAVITEEVRRRLMSDAYRRQEELKHLCHTCFGFLDKVEKKQYESVIRFLFLDGKTCKELKAKLDDIYGNLSSHPADVITEEGKDGPIGRKGVGHDFVEFKIIILMNFLEKERRITGQYYSELLNRFESKL